MLRHDRCVEHGQAIFSLRHAPLTKDKLILLCLPKMSAARRTDFVNKEFSDDFLNVQVYDWLTNDGFEEKSLQKIVYPNRS